jgi:FAD/FMN-containing dehydrogenase
MQLSNWGNFPRIDTCVKRLADDKAIANEIRKAQSSVARGLGRCYGDSALNRDLVLSMLSLAHLIDFDESTGLLTCEAGMDLSSILDVFLPRGWFLPVTPGTRFITVGGAIASDIHGKNHHVAGSFSRHVSWFDLLTADGNVVRCSRSLPPELFHATCGGQGLTGVILRAAFTLQRVDSAFIRQETIKAANLDEIMEQFEASDSWTYSVAWIDCLQSGKSLGRSALMRGEHAHPDELKDKMAKKPFRRKNGTKLNVPIDFPSFALNTLSVKAFNALYYSRFPEGVRESIVTLDSFFYPLDAVGNWNRVYGKRGFTQYQFVLPKEAARKGLKRILERIAASGQGSFLAVLKLFGPGDPGYLSFPMEGWTLALDFPICKRLFPLLDELDAIVLDHGGHHYLTKDARLDADVFAASYGERINLFRRVKSQYDPDSFFTSLQSERLGLGGAHD